MPGVRYTEEVRQQAVALALDPHVTLAHVASEVGCSLETIHRWLRQHHQQKASPSSEKTPFVPVNIIDAGQHPIEIQMPNGITIKLTDASPRYVAELLTVLASC